VATNYSLPVAPTLNIIFQEVAEKMWENFYDVNLRVDGPKDCLSHKTTDRWVKGVGVGELWVLLEYKSVEGVNMTILNENILF
jgi:hypothetical protein